MYNTGTNADIMFSKLELNTLITEFKQVNVLYEEQQFISIFTM